MKKDRNRELIIRRERFRRLLADRRAAFPDETYDESFRAVAGSRLGSEFFANMERSQSISDSARAKPVTSADPQAVFKSKDEAKAAFLAQVEKWRQKGISYSEAWNLAGNSTGKAAFRAWHALAEKEKGLPADHLRLRRTPPTL